MFCSIYCLNTSKSHTINANTTKAKHSKEYWKLIEQKKKTTKIKNGHNPNWVNSEKAKNTIAKYIIENPDYYDTLE